MKRSTITAAITLTLCGLLAGPAADPAAARRLRLRQPRQTATRTVSQARTVRPCQIIQNWRTAIRADDQAAAEAKAATQQATGKTGHIGKPIGDFEGTGFSTTTDQPATCTPPAGMTLTADATKCGANGCFRVRAWRKNP